MQRQKQKVVNCSPSMIFRASFELCDKRRFAMCPLRDREQVENERKKTKKGEM